MILKNKCQYVYRVIKPWQSGILLHRGFTAYIGKDFSRYEMYVRSSDNDPQQKTPEFELKDSKPILVELARVYNSLVWSQYRRSSLCKGAQLSSLWENTRIDRIELTSSLHVANIGQKSINGMVLGGPNQPKICDSFNHDG